MTTVVPAKGAILDRILESTHPTWHQNLSREAYRRFTVASLRTAWAPGHQRRYALVDGGELLASAMQYTLPGVLDGCAVRLCGIGSVFTQPAHRGRGHARALVGRLLEDAARNGADMALLFSESGREGHAPPEFVVIPTTDVELRVAESPRHGAPMTMIRGGEERDLAAIAAMGQVRAGPFRFHLDRDIDLIQHAITRTRLLAGLGPAGARQLHFFIAEEGITAAAYAVITIAGGAWTIEECGDRDPSGARVGAILQALLAREPAEHRPSIRARLPHGFVPPQVTVAASRPSTAVLMARLSGSRAVRPPLSGEDLLYWGADIF